MTGKKQQMNEAVMHVAQVAYGKVAPQYEGVKGAKKLNVDLGEVGDVLLRVANVMKEEADVAARFALVPGALFDTTFLKAIETHGWALKYVDQMWTSEDVQATTVMISEALALKSKAVRERMLKVATYTLEGQPKYDRELAGIRRGSGYDDLALDLSRLAVVYTEQLASISLDAKYVATDVADANELSQAITVELNAGKKTPWSEAAYRAWTFVSGAYADVRATADWLFRFDAEKAELFPSLHARGAAEAKADVPKAEAPVVVTKPVAPPVDVTKPA